MRYIVRCVFFFFLLIVGCTRLIIDCSKNMSGIPSDQPRGQNMLTVGEDTSLVFFLDFLPVPLKGGYRPSMQEAIDNAIDKAGPEYDALIDAVVYKKKAYTILTLKRSYRIEGSPVKAAEVISENPNNLKRLLTHSRIKEMYAQETCESFIDENKEDAK